MNNNLKKRTTNLQAELYIDGATQGANPSIGGVGGFLTIGKDTYNFSEKMGWMTNNVAEYQALIKGLELAVDHIVDDLVVYSDSKLVVNQMKGAWKVKQQEMKTLHGRASRIANNIKYIEYKWIPREENSEADRLSKLALGVVPETVMEAEEVVDIVKNASKLLVKETERVGGNKVITITCVV